MCFSSKNSRYKRVIYLCTGEGKSAKLGPNLKVELIFCLNLNEQQNLLVVVSAVSVVAGVDDVTAAVAVAAASATTSSVPVDLLSQVVTYPKENLVARAPSEIS